VNQVQLRQLPSWLQEGWLAPVLLKQREQYKLAGWAAA
jgi:hypothetical protein